MTLYDYQKKRNFETTPEPSGEKSYKANRSRSIFVVQKHDASRLHYDFRLEVDGVLKSWAVPKGPTLDPSQKRLAMMVEDHPYSYRNFEGEIEAGNYGAGEVIVWDKGTYTVPDTKDKKTREETILDSIEKGKIVFVLQGQKLKGEFTLIKMKGQEKNAWLLIKHRDKYAVNKNSFSASSGLSSK